MYAKNDCKKYQADFYELLKIIRESICSIRQTINQMNARVQKTGEYEQCMFKDIHCLLTAMNHALKHSYYHTNSTNELHDVRSTHDLIKQACTELEQQITRISISKTYPIHEN